MPSLSKTAITTEDQGPKWGFYLLIAGVVLIIGCYVYCSQRQHTEELADAPTVIIEPLPNDNVPMPPVDPNAYPADQSDNVPAPVDLPPLTP